MPKGSKQNRQVENQVGPGRPKDQRQKRKTEGHTNPPNQERGKQIQLGKRCRGSSLKLQVLHLHKDIMQTIIARFLRSQMTLNLKITLKLNLVNCRMIFHFLIRSLNSPLHVKLQELVMVEPQMAPLLKVSGSLQSLENDQDRLCLLVASH